MAEKPAGGTVMVKVLEGRMIGDDEYVQGDEVAVEESRARRYAELGYFEILEGKGHPSGEPLGNPKGEATKMRAAPQNKAAGEP